jgi:hypothetical protein
MKKNWIVSIYIISILIVIPSILILIAYILQKYAGIQELLSFVFSSILILLFGGLFFRLVDIYMERTLILINQMAIANNIEIKERNRSITFYDTDPKYYEEAPVVCYGVGYRFPRTAIWSLLLPNSMKGEYPNGWNLLLKEGEISLSTRKLISLIALEIASDKRLNKANIEIDSTKEKVWVAFRETRNKEVVKMVFDFLKRISEAQE